MPIIDMAATGQNIRDMRMAAGVTIKDMQDKIGVSAQAICKWQKGDAMPTIDNMVIIAAILNTTIDQIIVTQII